MNIYDLIIIGAGPAGLAAAVFAHNQKLSVAIVEGYSAGGQLKGLYPYKPIYNYPGFAEINGGELADSMLKPVIERKIEIFENLPVSQIILGADSLFTLNVLSEDLTQELRCKSVIMACGNGLFKPRKLDVENEQELEKKCLHYFVKDPSEFKSKKIVVVGGGNSAVDNALFLENHAESVTLVHLLKKFQADNEGLEKLEASTIKVLTEMKIVKIVTNDSSKGLFNLYLENTQSQESIVLENVDKILVNIGLKPDLSFLDDLNIERVKKLIKVDTEMRSSISGIYACGDVVHYEGKVRLIVTAIGEAATAVNSIKRFLKKGKQDNE